MNSVDKTICLLYTTYHSYLWDLICEETDNDNVLVINFSKRKLKGGKCYVIERESCNKIVFFLRCIKIALELRFSKYNLILPHPDHLLGNYLFFSSNVSSVTIIEDGVLNYYQYKRGRAINKRIRRRVLVTFLTPFRYYNYKGHLSGVEDCRELSVFGWFSDPEKIVCKDRFRSLYKINFPVTDKVLEPNGRVVFLDQPIEAFLQRGTAFMLRERLRDVVENNFSEVVVKPHPEYKENNITLKNKVIIEFDSSKPIEEIIMDLNPDAVISFCSSALINISRMSKYMKCISVGINEITEEVPGSLIIKEMYKENKVEFF